MLIHENSDIYIVDWDEPIMAPKERDLMFIGGAKQARDFLLEFEFQRYHS